MSKRLTLVASLALVPFALAKAAIDPTPTLAESVCEGVKFKELVFKDGERQVSYQLPAQWNYRPRAGEIQLTPPEKLFAEAIISLSPLPKPQNLDEKSIETLKERFLASLPAGSQMVSVVQEEQNPILLNNSPSYEVTVTYQALGETFLRSALFTNVADTQMTFRLTARKSDFEGLHRAFRSSLISWQWMESRTDPPKNAPSVTTAPSAQAPSITN